MSRPPLDTGGGRPTTAAELSVARQIVDRAGLVDLLAPHLDSEVGRPRTLSLLGFLVAGQLNALHRHHQGHLVEIVRVLNALTDDQRRSLGVVSWDPDESYDRVGRLFARLSRVLESGEAGIDASACATRLARAAIPAEMLTIGSVAVDGTDVETWGALHGEATTVALDGEGADTQLVEEGAVPKPKKPTRKAKILSVGPDGRNRYTVDPDARAGHRSATNTRPAGPYVGYELHLAVQARRVRWTNHVDRTTLGPRWRAWSPRWHWSPPARIGARRSSTS